MQKLREEDGVNFDEEDNDAVWQGWDTESSENGEDGDQDVGWINVDDDEDEPLVISDSEDEKAENGEPTLIHESPNPPRISTLATSKVSLANLGMSVYRLFLRILDFDTCRFCTPQRPSDTSCYQGCGKYRW